MKKYLMNEKVSVWCYDKYGERKDLHVGGILVDCEMTAEKCGYIIYDVYYNNIQASFDHISKKWYINE